MPRMPPTTDDLAAACDELRRGWRDADADALDALIDGDATIVWFGRESCKGALVDAAQTGRLRIADWKTVRERVRVLGELGRSDELAQITWSEFESAGGAPSRPAGAGSMSDSPHAAQTRSQFAGSRLIRVTATWQLTDEWRLVAAHATAADPRTLATWA